MKKLIKNASILFFFILLLACSEGSNPLTSLFVEYLKVLTLTDEDNEGAKVKEKIFSEKREETTKDHKNIVIQKHNTKQENTPKIKDNTLYEKNGLMYLNNKPYTGNGITNHPDGILASKQYTNGVLNGSSIEIYPNGQKRLQEYYVNGKNDGVSTFWYENGQKKKETYYINGEPNGLETKWYENGNK